MNYRIFEVMETWKEKYLKPYTAQVFGEVQVVRAGSKEWRPSRPCWDMQQSSHQLVNGRDGAEAGL